MLRRTGRARRAVRPRTAVVAGRPARARRRARRRVRRARRPARCGRRRSLGCAPRRTTDRPRSSSPPSTSPPGLGTRSAMGPSSGTSQRPSTHACSPRSAPRPRRPARRAAVRARDDHRLARAGLAGHRGEAGPSGRRRLGDHAEVADAELFNHAALADRAHLLQPSITTDRAPPPRRREARTC